MNLISFNDTDLYFLQINKYGIRVLGESSLKNCFQWNLVFESAVFYNIARLVLRETNDALKGL